MDVRPDRVRGLDLGTTALLSRRCMLVHVSAFNLGLLMRKMFGFGTPRDLQGRLAAALASFSDAFAAPLSR